MLTWQKFDDFSYSQGMLIVIATLWVVSTIVYLFGGGHGIGFWGSIPYFVVWYFRNRNKKKQTVVRSEPPTNCLVKTIK